MVDWRLEGTGRTVGWKPRPSSGSIHFFIDRRWVQRARRDPVTFEGLARLGLEGPAGVAAVYHLQFVQQALANTDVAVGQSFNLNLSNVDLSQAITLVNFGDGTPVEQTLSASHVYQTTGVQHVRVIAINGGAVDEFSTTVNVGAAPGLPASSASSAGTVTPPETSL